MMPEGLFCVAVAVLCLLCLAEGAALAAACRMLRRWKRRAAQEAESSSFYREVLDDLPGYVFIKDADHDFRYLYMNRNHQRLPVRDDAGCPVDDLLFAGEAGDIRQRDAEIARSGGEDIDFRTIQGVDGGRIEVKIWKRLLVRNGARLIIGIGTDISHERALERKLAEQFRELDASMRDEQSINRCLSLLVTTDDFDAGVRFILDELGERSGADLCAVYLLDRDRRALKRTHDWRRQAVTEWPRHSESFHADGLERFPGDFREHREVEIPDAARPPEGLEAFAEQAVRLGMSAVLISGVWRKSELAGVICLYYANRPSRFAEADRHRLHNASSLYALLAEREQRLREIQENISLKEQIFASIAMPVVMFDMDYNIVMVNPSACEALKCPETEVIGRKCYEILCDCAAPPEWCPMKRATAERQAVSIDFAGHGRQYLVTVQPVFDRDGNMIYALETAVDIFEQREQEQQLIVKNLQLNRVAELARITYFVGEGGFEVRIIGGNRDIGLSGVNGESIDLMLWAIPEDRPEIQRQRDGMVAGRNEYAELICRSDAGGMRRTFRLLVARDNGSSGRHFGFIQDITADIALEGERRELIRSLEGYVENERVMNSCLSQIMLEEDFDRNVNSIMRIIATQLNGCRAYLGAFDEFGRRFEVTHEWFGREAGGALRGRADAGLAARSSQWYGRFLRDELVTAPDAGEADCAEELQAAGCRTLICAPIWLGNELYGVLGIGFKDAGRTFSAQEKNVLRSTAQILALAQTRQRQCETVRTLHLQSQIIIDAIPIPVLLFSVDGQLLRCNPAAGDLCGRSAETMLRIPCFKNLCGYDRTPEFCPVQKAIHSGRPCSCRLILHRRECVVAATPVRNRAGEITHVLETVIDLTEIYEGKRKLEEAVRAADSANTAKSSFIAAISHEMRTPLSSVIGFSELLRNDQLPRAEQLEYIESINQAGNALLALINEVIDLAKLEAGQLEIVPQWQELPPLLVEIEAEFRRMAREKPLELVLERPAGLPRLQLDGARLRQILLKLLAHAVNHLERGTVTLAVQFRPGGDQRGTLLIQVREPGVAMPAEELEKLFQPYDRAEAARDGVAYLDSGLGLPICRRLLKRMGGAIRAESDGDAGCRFCLELPELPCRDDAETVPAVPASDAASGLLPAPEKAEAPEKADAPLRILVVDDVPMNLKVLSAILRKLKTDPIIAQSGSEALELLNKMQADLVLTDLWMPGMNGDELATAIHRLDGMADLTIYAVTADMEAQHHFERKEFRDILLKPVTLDGLQKLLDRVRSREDDR